MIPGELTAAELAHRGWPDKSLRCTCISCGEIERLRAELAEAHRVAGRVAAQAAERMLERNAALAELALAHEVMDMRARHLAAQEPVITAALAFAAWPDDKPEPWSVEGKLEAAVEAYRGWVPAPAAGGVEKIRARLDDGANPFDMTAALRAVLDLAAAHGLCHFQPCDQRVGCPSLDVLDLLSERLGVES